MTALGLTTISNRVSAQARVVQRRSTAPRVETFAGLSDCESLWREFQDSGISTPFQRFDWVAAFLRSRPEGAHQTRVVLARGADGLPTMLLPLTIERRLGLRVASPVGGKQANYKMPILARETGSTLSELTGLLEVAGSALGVDVFQFLGTPAQWGGEPNRLAQAGGASPSNAFRLELGASGEETLSRALKRGARKKLRQKEKWLARLGAVDRVEPIGTEAIDKVLDAFFQQKGERLRQLGITDPFACGHARAFLREGCRPAGSGLPAPIELHALTLDGRPVAVFAGAVDRERMSGMIISFDASDEIARCSPGDLLVARVIEAQCQRGRKVFDLGVGEARYKRSFCDGMEDLRDVLIPVTETGAAYAAAARLAMVAKRYVKQTSWTMRLLSTMRRGTALLT